MPDSRSAPTDAPARNRALVERYFEMVASGDPEIASLFADDVRWITPRSSPMAGTYEGKDAVLALMAGGAGLYDPSHPLDIRQDAVAATEDHVFVEMTMTARTRQGDAYENHYVLVFRLRGGRIAEVREHLDTHYAQRLLFDPVGQKSPLDSGEP